MTEEKPSLSLRQQDSFLCSNSQPLQELENLIKDVLSQPQEEINLNHEKDSEKNSNPRP